MKTIENNTYDRVSEMWDNCQLDREQCGEFETLSAELADGSIDGDAFAEIWSDLFPNF